MFPAPGVMPPLLKNMPGGTLSCIVYIGKATQSVHVCAEHGAILQMADFQYFQHFWLFLMHLYVIYR